MYITMAPTNSTVMQASPTTTPSVAEIERIAALADPVVRNLHITQAYHELSAAFAARTGPQANWNTFATWASKQAGQTIRQEDLTRLHALITDAAPNLVGAFDGLLDRFDHVESVVQGLRLDDALDHIFDGGRALSQASDAIARGNLKVFAEIGSEFARFLAMLDGEQTYRPELLAAFTAELEPGEAPDGQDLLRQAFTHYYQALFATDVKVRAELMYLANIEIGFHEQTRLQPEIKEAMNAVIEVLPDVHGLNHSFGLLQKMLPAMQTMIASEARLAVTRFLMTLGLPAGRLLRLGADLRADFAELLQTLHNTELRALLARVTPRPDDLRGSGASDWADLQERMHFIASMFRIYHQDAGLLQPPFSVQQVQLIKQGRQPGGPL